MREVFDKRKLARLVPTSHAYSVRELVERKRDGQTIATEGPPGFIVRVHPNGSKRWCFEYMLRRKRRRLVLGDFAHMSVREARALYTEAYAKKSRGIDPVEEIELNRERERDQSALNSAPTVNDLCDLYLRRRVGEKRTVAEDRRQIDRDIRPTIGKQAADGIRRKDLFTLLDAVVDRGSPVAANRLLALLKTMFAFAEEREIVPASPCSNIRRPHKEQPRQRDLSLEEVCALLSGLPRSRMGPVPRNVLRMLLMTGQRLGEVAGARWDEFDSEAWNLSGDRTKNAKSHRVPLTSQLLTFLDSLRKSAGDSPFVFPAKSSTGHVAGSSISSALGKERDEQGSAFGVDHFRLHDLRHTFASRLAELGTEQEVIARLLNHSLSGITARYNQFDYWAPARRAMEKWHSHLLAATGDTFGSDARD